MQEQDYKTLAHSRLTDRHRSDETFLAILDTLVEIKSQRQEQYLNIADAFLDIDKSEGKNLDLIGRLIGEERTLVNFIDRSYFGFLGARLSESYDVGYWYSLYKNKYGTLRTLTDEEYRRVLKARVVKNSSDNNRNSLLEVLNILADNDSAVIVESENNTAIEVRIKDIDGLASYYLSKYKSDNNLIPVPLGRRLGIAHTQSDSDPILKAPTNVTFEVEVYEDPEQPLPNEIYFTTTTGTIDYSGSKGDQILLSDGSTLTLDTDYVYDLTVPSGKHKIVLVEARKYDSASLGGEALVEIHNFPTLDSIKAFDTYPNNPSSNLVKVPTTLPSNIVHIQFMFSGAESFNQDISMWDTSNVINMRSMFEGASLFNQDISSWNVSNVTDMSNMFSYTNSFDQDISNWDVSNVTDMSYMFDDAISFNQDISMWNVSNVTDMGYMFHSTNSFNQDISGWDVSNVTNMAYMFGSSNAFNQPLNSWDVSNVTDMSGMFGNSDAFNQPLNSWNVSNVTDMSAMFQSVNTFDQDLSQWNVSNVINMDYMFYAATSFNQDLSNWCVTNITSEPVNFSFDSPLTEEHKPVWGTCPRGENIPDGVWILNQGHEIIGNDVKYTAYKTDNLDYYDSFALVDLVQVLVNSFHDPDLQQYDAFTTAVDQLTGATDWVLDVANDIIKKKVSDGTVSNDNFIDNDTGLTGDDLCFSIARSGGFSPRTDMPCFLSQAPNSGALTCFYSTFYRTPTSSDWWMGCFQNATYTEPQAEYEDIPLSSVAIQVISNAESSTDEVLQLLSQDYITAVANSVFETDSSKQFVTLEDLEPQLEANKMLRS